jgi:hypothetical protein
MCHSRQSHTHAHKFEPFASRVERSLFLHKRRATWYFQGAIPFFLRVWKRRYVTLGLLGARSRFLTGHSQICSELGDSEERQGEVLIYYDRISSD